MSIRLTDNERRWVAVKWQEIRAAQRTADRANAAWKRANSLANQQLDHNSDARVRQGRDPLSEFARAKMKSESLPLKDALDTGKWHSANAQRHIDDLHLFLKMKELGL
jgi:hypothetical protein